MRNKDKKMIVDPRWSNPEYPWPAHSGTVKEFLGLDRKAKLPAEGMPPREIQGFQVYVLSLTEARAKKQFHRVMAICPTCGKHLSAGRLQQHQHVDKETSNV
jgi:hypothetical protein